ncbi:hypothetical protein ACQ4PT_045849 [Festuca glaucescens]
MASTPERPQWSNMLPDLLGQVIARLPHIADRAHFHAVCRSWHSAVRLHVSPRHRLPWVVLEDGAYLTPSDGSVHRLPFPKNTTCVGSTNDWIALDSTDEVTQTHTYTLHNHFSGATVRLPELDAIIGKVPEDFEVRKVLMRSTPDDFIAITGNIWKNEAIFPMFQTTNKGNVLVRLGGLILCRPGKGTWVPRLLAMPYFRIIDLVFLGDKLYAITKAEDLFVLHLAEDGDGRPTITSVKRIIRHAPGHNDDVYDVGVWMRFTDIDEDTDEELGDEAPSEENNQDVLNHGGTHEELVVDNDGNDDDDYERFAFVEEETLSECEDGIREGYDAIHTSRNLVESQGKLLMVRRVHQISAFTPTDHTRKVEVFEADMKTGAWVPMNSGLGSGQAIFISNRFSNIISACGEVEEDVVYFPDSNDVFDMKSRIIRPTTPMDWLSDKGRAWVFPPNLVV